MSALVVDIETVPLAASLALPYVPADNPPPANYGEEAVAKFHAKAEAAWGEKLAKDASTNPRLGRIVCLGTSNAIELAETEADEPAILRSFWGQVKDASGYVVTWNGMWDLRFLVTRSLAHDIRPTVTRQTVREWFRKYYVAPHFDCRAVLTNWGPPSAGDGLEVWADFFKVTGEPDPYTGADIAWLYAEGLFDDIAAHCAHDVRKTAAVYERIAHFYGAE